MCKSIPHFAMKYLFNNLITSTICFRLIFFIFWWTRNFIEIKRCEGREREEHMFQREHGLLQS